MMMYEMIEPSRANFDSTQIPLRFLYFDIFKDVAKQLDIDNGSSLQKNWKTLASLLDFKESDIRGIERERPRSLTLKVLSEFFVVYPQFTVQDFISILEKMGRQESIFVIRRGLMSTYLHPFSSSFDHAFRRRFNLLPSQYFVYCLSILLI